MGKPMKQSKRHQPRPMPDDGLDFLDKLANTPAVVAVLGRIPPYKRARRQKWQACGAYARRTGKPCKAPGTGGGGRCKQHGGLSTGPKTPEGRHRCGQALRDWHARRRAAARKRACARQGVDPAVSADGVAA